MINGIIYVSEEDMKEVKRNLKQDDKTYIAEIDGEQCPYAKDYLKLISDLLQFPMKAKGLDGYNDWMRDLSWINKDQIIIIINKFLQFLEKDIPSKEAVLEDFSEVILPWWEAEVIDCMVGGKTKKVSVYLVH